MLFSVITPSYNSGRFLEQTIQSVLGQRNDGVNLEYIVVDGNSADETHSILDKYSGEISHVIIESDTGPANAINKGFAKATGDVVSWLNGDDIYYPGTLKRVEQARQHMREAAVYFGSCPIIDEHSGEIRKGITRFKELFYPLSCRFTYQCINYLSQPALFFNREAVQQAGPLREDMVAAWDYEFMLRLIHFGSVIQLNGGPLAAFRWHEQSISGQRFSVQFREEYEAVAQDAGPWSPQAIIHFFVRWGIVGIYSLMTARRALLSEER